MSFTFTPSEILPEVIIIEYDRYIDDRGFFSEIYRESEFCKYGMPKFVQENHSRSSANVFRGLHCQWDSGQAKLVSVSIGEIYDYVVDIRIGSPTYGKHIKINLNEDDPKMVYIPSNGFLHGFLSLPGSKIIDVRYKVSKYYSPERDQSVNVMDPDLEIILPSNVELSTKDMNAPMLKDIRNDFYY